MENLIKKLEEVGLTEDQALKAIDVFKDFMDEEDLKINWSKFFKGKYEDLSDKTKSLYDKFYNGMSLESQSYADKITGKVDQLATKAKKGAHDISQKAADFFDEKK